MALVVRRAEPRQLEAVFRGRHQVYVEEMGAMTERVDGQISDRFDWASSTLNVVVIDDATDRIVGGARWVKDTGRGTTADRYYDFTGHLPGWAVAGAGSMLWMLPEARGRRGVIGEMMAEGLAWCLEQGITHVLATVNPPVAGRFEKVGYRRVGEPFLHGAEALPVQPMVLTTAHAVAIETTRAAQSQADAA